MSSGASKTAYYESNIEGHHEDMVAERYYVQLFDQSWNEMDFGN